MGLLLWMAEKSGSAVLVAAPAAAVLAALQLYEEVRTSLDAARHGTKHPACLAGTNEEAASPTPSCVPVPARMLLLRSCPPAAPSAAAPLPSVPQTARQCAASQHGC